MDVPTPDSFDAMVETGVEAAQGIDPNNPRWRSSVGARIRSKHQTAYKLSLRGAILDAVATRAGAPHQKQPEKQMAATSTTSTSPTAPTLSTTSTTPRRARVEKAVEHHLAAQQATRSSSTTTSSRPDHGPRGRFTLQMGKQLQDRLRDAVDALSGPPVRATVASLVEAAVEHHLARLEAENNAGQPFPRRQGGLRRGPRA